ncbi:MAG: LiaF transmembrane domain-containing protein, partial [Candidatus Acidiferrales bacterium]
MPTEMNRMISQTTILLSGNVFLYWPMLLVLVGIIQFFRSRSSAARQWGGALVPLGVLLQLAELSYSGLSTKGFWPILLVVERLWTMCALVVKLDVPAFPAWLTLCPLSLVVAGLIFLPGQKWQNRGG